MSEKFIVSNVRREDLDLGSGEIAPAVQFIVSVSEKTIKCYEWLNVDNDGDFTMERIDSATKTNNNGLLDFCKENEIDENEVLDTVWEMLTKQTKETE